MFILLLFIQSNNYLEMSMLTDNIMDYYFVAQGKTTIPGVDDAEELTLTDVRRFAFKQRNFCF